MPGRLFLRPEPRAFFLITDTHALVFRQPDASETKAARSVVVAEFLPLDEVDTSGLISVGRSRSVEGVLGVTSVPSDRSPVPDVFLLLLTGSTPLAPLIPSSSLRPARVLAVEFYSLTSAFWDPPGLVPDARSAGFHYDDDNDDDDLYSSRTAGNSQVASTQSQAAQQGVENPCNGMKKYLESGGFFFAMGCKWDISTRVGETNWLQAELGTHNTLVSPLETFDERFVWNASLLAPFLTFRDGLSLDDRIALDAEALLVPIIQGFCGSKQIATGGWTHDDKPEMGAIALISRLSWKRAGARFRTRGIDDDGQVANFVETETILATGSVCVSYVQVRGSVPLFWQQPSQGIQTLQQKVEITRPPQATQPAFDKHFLELLEHYHAVHAVNLLGQKDAEAMLSAAYSDHLASLHRSLRSLPENADPSLAQDAISLTPYDFHAAVKVGGHEAVKADLSSLPEIDNSIDNFGWTIVDTTTGEIIDHQNGVFRVNCLDCLDRTNYVQDVISSITLTRFLSSLAVPLLNSTTLWTAHRELWADNGDLLSKIYAGTGAINTSATRSGKKTFAGLLSDATKSVSRAYVNNFQDKGKQKAIDMLLGLLADQRPVVLFDPISDSIQSALIARKDEYSTPLNLVIFSGTWNLNGKPPSETLQSWLFPQGLPTADIYAVAFQEIVELTPQQILQTDPGKRLLWEAHIMYHFQQLGSESYVRLRSDQLVGTALVVMVKSSLLPAIRNVESANKKTGLQGLSGNKGGVGIRFTVYDTSICLMTCHLAAGHSNYADRNADYRTISQGLTFLRGKTIDSHDIVIWGADFNYRIDLPNLDVREYATNDDLDPLIAADQLARARDDNEVFIGYSEGRLNFRPTYKYDNGTDEYDTSEKARIPAWTDRILFKGERLFLTAYDCASLRSSDHRPVYAIFDATVRVVNDVKKSEIASQLTQKAHRSNLKIDSRVEKAAQGGVRSLVKEFTAVSVTSTPKPTFSRDTKPKPRPTAPSATTLSAIAAATARLAQPPPLPSRVGTSQIPASDPKRASSSPPITDFQRIGLPLRSLPSEMLTPVTTGDFVLVPSQSRPPRLPARSGSVNLANKTLSISPVSTSSLSSSGSRLPPPLPSRPTPTLKRTLDLDSSPPEGLAVPVLPDQVVPTLNATPLSSPTIESSMDANSKSRDRPTPPPKPLQLKSKAV